MLKGMKAIALSAALITTSLLPKQGAAHAQAAPVVVQACWSSGYCAATVVVVGGVYYWAISRSGQIEYYPYGDGGHLENPEGNSEEWSDYIWADNDEQAQRRCQLYAHNAGAVYVTHRAVGRNRYECVVRTYRS